MPRHGAMAVCDGVASLTPAHGGLFVVIGVFDGLHRGHAYLLDALVREAAARGARPAVITFDHHPDEVITGAAPPLLLDPAERLERLAAAGVEVAIVHHFDAATRETPFDTFVRAIEDRVDLAGFLMTPESAFGHDRGGTPATVAALGDRLGFEVVVVPTLELEGQPVRSTDIRAAIARGDLPDAERLLGLPYAVIGDVTDDGHVQPGMPVALPPAGTYEVDVDGRAGRVFVEPGAALVLGRPQVRGSRVRLEFKRRAGRA